MGIKEYLSQPVLLDKAINEAMLELEKLKQLALVSKSFVTASSGSGRVSTVEETVEKICRMEEKINRTIDRYVDTKAEVEQLIDKLPSMEQRTLLKYHYILGHTWEQVSEECYISIRNVHYIHGKALGILSGMAEGITA
ncbi:MAG: DUF1492 domain-containing protein [Ruminiclostridium sp.]